MREIFKIRSWIGQAILLADFKTQGRLSLAKARYKAILVAAEDRAHSPAVEFEKMYNLKGFSEAYVYPEGMSPQRLNFISRLEYDPIIELYEIQKAGYTSAAQIRRLEDNTERVRVSLNDLNNELAFLNPQLGAVRRSTDDIRREYDFLFGVINRFPPRDIDYFLNGRGGLSQDEYEKRGVAVREAVAKFNALTGQKRGHVEWIVSPETIGLMHAVADHRHNQTDPTMTEGTAARPRSRMSNLLQHVRLF